MQNNEFIILNNQEEEKAHALEAIGLLGRGPMKAQATVTVPLPSTGDDYESDVSVGSDDESRPLTQSELISRIMKGVWDCLLFNIFMTRMISCHQGI